MSKISFDDLLRMIEEYFSDNTSGDIDPFDLRKVIQSIILKMQLLTPSVNEEQEALWKNLQNLISSGINGIATSTNSPKPWTSGDPDLFERYLVESPATLTNYLDENGDPIIVTSGDFDYSGAVPANRVSILVTNGVASKYIERVKGDKGDAADPAKIVKWTATTYASGAQVIYDNRHYESNAATIATDIPGISSVWDAIIANKFPYENNTPFTGAALINRLDKWLINLYLDFEFAAGFRYSFSIISKTNLTARLYKHVDGQPAAGNLTTVFEFTFTKITNSKYYIGKTAASPNSWVIADFDVLIGDVSSRYYTHGIGISPRVFKNGKITTNTVQSLGNSETDVISQKKVTEELAKRIEVSDTLSLDNIKINSLSYKHSAGDTYYTPPGVYLSYDGAGVYLPPQEKKLLVRKIGFNLFISSSVEVTAHVYTGTVLNSNPGTNKTLVETIVIPAGKFKNSGVGLQYITLTNDLILDVGEYLYIYAEVASGAIRIPIWDRTADANTPHPLTSMIFKTSGNWAIGSGVKYLTAPLLIYSSAIDESVISELVKDVADHEQRINVLEGINEPAPEIILPDTIQAVVGDTLQLFYRSIIKAKNPYRYNIVINCAIGRNFPRYYELLSPTSDQVGTYSFTVTLKDSLNNTIVTKTVNLVVAAAGTSPATMKTILGLGDSLTRDFVWGIEANRRLTGSGGTPAGRGFTNIQFKGRKTNGTLGWEGNGGWSWSDYTTAGRPAYRFEVSGVTIPPVIGNTYTNNGVTFTVAEVNITSGTGNIRMTYASGTPTASGTLTRTLGSGDATIAFSSYTAEGANPFWVSGALNFTNYVDAYMDGSVDVVYVLLSWNGQTAYRTDFSADLAHATTLFNHMKAAYPNIKIKLMGVQLPSQNGGMGTNYGATGDYSDTYGMAVTALNMNKAYQAFANQVEFSSFVEFLGVASQFDSENNMPESDMAVNTRSSKTEKRGTNGVHPAAGGYYQIADVVYRNFVANFCQ